jgi:hypothetical protein
MEALLDLAPHHSRQQPEDDLSRRDRLDGFLDTAQAEGSASSAGAVQSQAMTPRHSPDGCALRLERDDRGLDGQDGVIAMALQIGAVESDSGLSIRDPVQR